MTSEEKVMKLFREVCKDESFFWKASCNERYLYNMFMCEAVRDEMQRIEDEMKKY